MNSTTSNVSEGFISMKRAHDIYFRMPTAGNLERWERAVAKHAETAVRSIPQDFDFSSMPYSFWEKILIVAKHQTYTCDKLVSRMSVSDLHQYLSSNHSRTLMDISSMLEVVSMRNDEMGKSPEELAKLYNLRYNPPFIPVDGIAFA